ncbi:MAG: T9SS type A sorting domain-containing protein, partial [Candidatus Marinimicrobia bacterium]|nr:T9SS type A sorting domain-containing protein [Candidatus Neomarinimicrobiota bacterium]
ASSAASALEALVGETMLLLIPAPNWNGTANIALSVSDGQATQRDTFAVTVEAEPDIPSTFSLLEPDDNTIILITQDLLDDSLLFAWEPSTDPDGDPVTYLFTLGDGQNSFEYDDTSATEVRVPYADIIAAMKDKNLSIATFEWSVVAISKQDSVDAANGLYRLTIDMSTLGVTGNSQLPQLFALHQNYPNPFNPVTTIRYELPAQTRVILVIYDLRGKEVVRLVDGYESAGYKKVVWNSSNAAGRPVPTGLYFARLVTSAYTHTIKLTLIK